jgi:YesN/AraC family two-component response regulator
VREGLVTILALQQDLQIVGQARNGQEACLLYDELSPDVFILDLRMPKKDGQEVVTAPRAMNQNTNLLTRCYLLFKSSSLSFVHPQSQFHRNA